MVATGLSEPDRFDQQSLSKPVWFAHQGVTGQAVTETGCLRFPS
jgi:hypothetical protein